MKRKQVPEEKQSFLGLLFELEKRATLEPHCPGSGCQCLCCSNHDGSTKRSRVNELNSVRGESCLSEFLSLAHQCSPCPPNLPILDTVVFKNGRPHLTAYYQGKLKIVEDPTQTRQKVKDYLIRRKNLVDLEYLKRDYKKKNPSFVFILLDFESQKLTKSFEAQIKSIHPMQRKVCSIKRKGQVQQAVLTQSGLDELLRTQPSAANKLYPFEEIEHIQLFPTPINQQQQCRLRVIHFDRQMHLNSELYDVAEQHYCVWTQRNQTLQEMERRYLSQNIKDVEQYLLYAVFKLAVHLQYACNTRVLKGECQFYSDKHQQFWLKDVRNFQHIPKVTNYSKHSVVLAQQQANNRGHRVIDPAEFIDLKSSMDSEFKGFQNKYKEIFATQVNSMMTELMDQEKSERTFRTITKNKDAKLQTMLLSTNVSKKKQLLELS